MGRFIHGIDTPWRRRRTNDRCYEAVAPSSDIRHVGFAVLAATQHPPQLSDVELQAALLHGQAGPGLFHEFRLADDLTLATDQNAENVERPATKLSPQRHRVPGGEHAEKHRKVRRKMPPASPRPE